MGKEPTDMKTYEEVNDKLSEQQKESLIIHLLNTIIIELSGGVGINTVTLTTPTGTLSDEDYAKILRDNCVIVMSTQYFRKQYSASTLVNYSATPRVGVDKVIFDYIDIDKETKAYELKHDEFVAV